MAVATLTLTLPSGCRRGCSGARDCDCFCTCANDVRPCDNDDDSDDDSADDDTDNDDADAVDASDAATAATAADADIVARSRFDRMKVEKRTRCTIQHYLKLLTIIDYLFNFSIVHNNNINKI